MKRFSLFLCRVFGHKFVETWTEEKSGLITRGFICARCEGVCANSGPQRP